MSVCNFNIPFSVDAETILAKAKKAVESQGGNFSGDVNGGQFDVSLMSNRIAGSYMVNGQQLELTITEKPMFVPCSAIESFLKSKLS